jgi:hypothetical protein
VIVGQETSVGPCGSSLRLLSAGLLKGLEEAPTQGKNVVRKGISWARRRPVVDQGTTGVFGEEFLK